MVVLISDGVSLEIDHVGCVYCIYNQYQVLFISSTIPPPIIPLQTEMNDITSSRGHFHVSYTSNSSLPCFTFKHTMYCHPFPFNITCWGSKFPSNKTSNSLKSLCLSTTVSPNSISCNSHWTHSQYNIVTGCNCRIHTFNSIHIHQNTKSSKHITKKQIFCTFGHSQGGSKWLSFVYVFLLLIYC